MLELSTLFVHECFICTFIYEKQKKKNQGTFDSFFCSKAKQPKLQLNEEEGSSNCGKQNTYCMA